MFNSIWTYLKFGRYYCGIEHTSLQERIFCTLLKKSKQQLEIDQVVDVTAVEDLAKMLPKKQHAFLIINDTNVLSKVIESEQNDNLKLVHKAFPNINLDDFYYEVLHEKHNHFLSLCRKTYVDDLIKNYNDLGLSIIGFSLGNTNISLVRTFINEAVFTTSNADILKENTTISIKEHQNPDIEHYNVNGLNVSNNHLLSLTGALQIALNKNNQQTNFEDQKETLFKAFLQSHFFNQFLKFAALFILGLLLVNFLFFNHYFNKVNDLEQTSVVNNSAKEQMLLLNESVNKKQKMTEDMLNNSTSKSAFYISHIIKGLPNSIVFSELDYQPLEKRVKVGKPIEVLRDIVIISGESSSSETFFNWVNTLESKNWVKSAEIADYGDTSSSKSSFSIKIIIDHE